MSDRQNVSDFRMVMKRAYKAQKKRQGSMTADEVQTLDKLFALHRGERCVARDGRVLFFWRTFRRRVSYKYAKMHNKPWVVQLDWNSIFKWIMDNWQLIIKTIIFLVPFVI